MLDDSTTEAFPPPSAARPWGCGLRLRH